MTSSPTKHTKFTDSFERQMFHEMSERAARFSTPLLPLLLTALKNAFMPDSRRRYTYPGR
ncbi:hypothetical protein AS149_36970 [Burkholderia cenocepacia]|nr:hypothetical protein AS149_36970 [Burkholderia cenocepacia]